MNLSTVWQGRAVLSQRKKIENVLDRADSMEDLELAAHLARYACVLVSGLLEVAISHILTEYTNLNSGKRAQRYITTELKRFQNPKVNKIVELMNKFDNSWSLSVSAALTEQLRDSIDSVVGNRNQIAHGKDTGITPLRVRAYFKDCSTAIDLIVSIVNGNPKT